MSLKQHCRQV